MQPVRPRSDTQAHPDERNNLLHSFSCSKRLFLIAGSSGVLYARHQIKYCQGMGAWIGAREQHRPSQKNKSRNQEPQERPIQTSPSLNKEAHEASLGTVC